jgi:biopolymer transport protein ExbD
MKKINLLSILLMLAMFISLSTASASELKKSEKNTATASTENTLSAEDVKILNLRVEEIRDMDKSDLTMLEKRELKNELKTIKKDLRNSNGAIYIGTGTLLLIIILIILLV